MVKRSVTLLEETIFQHVTIHKLMIYIYSKMKMSQDPLLAVIRTNILELKNMARCDPLVLIASSKTVLKTLLNFTRLTCINKEAFYFIRKLMHDVYVRMRKLWDIYKVHGSYEISKKIKVSNTEKLVKENIDSKHRQQKKTSKAKSVKKETTKNKVQSKNDIASEIESSDANELAKDGIFDKASLFERIKTLITESNEASEANQLKKTINAKDSVNNSVILQDSKSPKKRKSKKWSMGIFQAKKRKKMDHSNKTPTKTEPKTKITEMVEAIPYAESLPELEPEEPEIPEIIKQEILTAKDFEDDESSLDKYNKITKDAGWGERLRVQREYYLNEMSKATQRLDRKKNALPKYDFINKISNKLGISVTTCGYTLKELMVMDHTKLVQDCDNPSLPSQINWINMEPNSSSIVVAIFKATRIKKRFIYECLGQGCTLKSTLLQDLYKHAYTVHKPFDWDWSCSSCGLVQQVNILKNADLLDMAMYHLTAYHSTTSLKRNPVELEFTSLDLQVRNKSKMDSPLISQSTQAINKNNYCFQLYKCSKCTFASGLFSEAFNHFSLEMKDSSEINCIYCLKTETNAQALCEHLEMYHASSIFLCSECHYRSVSVCNTINHFFDEHEDIDENRDVLIYINTVPNGLKMIPPTFFPSKQLTRYICKHPDKEEFITLVGSKFVKHAHICPNQGGKRGGTVKKFECSLCSTKVGAAYRLRQHFETHQVALYVCVYCGQGYAKLSAIKEHLSRVHMMWYPRFIIREAYDECPEEITSHYSSIVRYETDLEALVEVSIEMEEYEEEKSRIKFQMISGELQKWESLLDNLYDINVSTKSEDGSEKDPNEVTQKSQELCLSEKNKQLTEGRIEEQHTPVTGHNRKQSLRPRNIVDADVIDLTYEGSVCVSEKIIEASKEHRGGIIEINSDSEEMNYSLIFGNTEMHTTGNYNRKFSSSKSTEGNMAEKSTSSLEFLSNKEATKSSAENSFSSPSKSTMAYSDNGVLSTIQGGSSFFFSSQKNMIKEKGESSTAKPPLAVLSSVLDPSTSQIFSGTLSSSPNLTSSSHVVKQQFSSETSSPVHAESRIPEIRVIAEAKMDNFRKSLPAASNLVKLNNLMKNDVFTDLNPPGFSYLGKAGDQSEVLKLLKTVPDVLRGRQLKPKSKMIQIPKIVKKNEPSKAICLLKCPYCNYKGQGKSALTHHISRIHVDVLNDSPTGCIGRNFICATCRASFEAFASLHKHMETLHERDAFGLFRVYVEGHLLVRKNIKICFMCSTLIVSLEQLYKHPDVCPFAHTTGTTLNSSIVYATGKCMKTCFLYKKSEIKVNKSIVELLQPHLPSSSSPDVPVVKRAVAKKSTGPRPLSQESSTSNEVSNIKRAVAKKSTGPYVLPSPNNGSGHSVTQQDDQT